MIEEIVQNKLSEMRVIQAELGISRANFERKFVYSYQQTSDAYLFERFQPCPSQLAGFSLENIDVISALASRLIFQAGLLLRLPVSTVILAQNILIYYYSRKSYIEDDIRDIAMGATFLACKSEQTLRKSYQISAVYDQLFKIYQGNRRPVKVLDPNSTEYTQLKKTIVKAQTDILFQLGFQVYKLFDIPHRYISGLLNTFDKHPLQFEIATKSWAFLNDIYMTRMCLYYPGQILAAAAVYMALRSLQIGFPVVPWWCLMEASFDAMEDIAAEVHSLLKKSDLITLQSVSQVIRDIAEKKHGLANVFPVPYYRKIMLHSRNKLKISIADLEKGKEIPQQPYADMTGEQQPIASLPYSLETALINDKPSQVFVCRWNLQKKDNKFDQTVNIDHRKDQRKKQHKKDRNQLSRDRQNSNQEIKTKRKMDNEQHERDDIRQQRDGRRHKNRRDRRDSRQKQYSRRDSKSRDNELTSKIDKKKHKQRDKEHRGFSQNQETPKLRNRQENKAPELLIESQVNPPVEVQAVTQIVQKLEKQVQKQKVQDTIEKILIKEGMQGLKIDKNSLKLSLNNLMEKHDQKMEKIEVMREERQQRAEKEAREKSESRSERPPNSLRGEPHQQLANSSEDSDMELLVELKSKMKQNKEKQAKLD